MPQKAGTETSCGMWPFGRWDCLLLVVTGTGKSPSRKLGIPQITGLKVQVAPAEPSVMSSPSHLCISLPLATWEVPVVPRAVTIPTSPGAPRTFSSPHHPNHGVPPLPTGLGDAFPLPTGRLEWAFIRL